MSDDERRAIEELARLRVEGVVAGVVSTLHSAAILRLGLLREAAEHRDLQQAALAIDTIAALVPVAERALPPASVGELRAALAQLQLAYAETAGTPPPPPPPGGGAGETPRPEPPPQRQQPPPGPAPTRPSIWTPRGEV
jgi:hypothetical protein